MCDDEENVFLLGGLKGTIRQQEAEIDRLRGLAIRAWHSFRSGLSQAGGCEHGLSDEDVAELTRMAKETPAP